MLEALRAKDPPANLTLVQARMEALDLARRDFALATAPFRAFMHLLTVDAQLAALTRIRDHLCADGWLALDVFDPDLARMAVGAWPRLRGSPGAGPRAGDRRSARSLAPGRRRAKNMTQGTS
jgi:hypothetical protein